MTLNNLNNVETFRKRTYDKIRLKLGQNKFKSLAWQKKNYKISNKRE